MLMKPLRTHTDSVQKCSKHEIERTYEQPLPQVQEAPHLQLELPQPDMVNDERAGKQKDREVCELEFSDEAKFRRRRQW